MVQRSFELNDFPFRLPPGPTGLPFLGVINKLDPLQVRQTLQEWKDQYGDIYSFTLPGQHVVVVSLRNLAEPEWPEWLSPLCCGMVGCWFEPQPTQQVRAQAQTSAPPMLVDRSDSYKYVGQSGLAAMLNTRLYSVHLYCCHTRCDLWDHCMLGRKSAGKRSTSDLKLMRKDTQSPKQEQSVAPQNGPTNLI